MQKNISFAPREFATYLQNLCIGITQKNYVTACNCKHFHPRFCIPAFSIRGAINGVRLAAAFPPGSARARINLSTPSALLPALAYTQRIQVAWINGDCKYPAFGQRHWIPKDQTPHFGKHFAYLQSWKAQVLESQYLTTLYGLQSCKIIMSFDTDYGSEWTYFCVQLP